MRVPSYRRHSSGQARVTIKGKDYLLGKFGSPESRERYGRLIAEFTSQPDTFGKEELLLEDVLLAYIRYAKSYYQESTEFANLKLAIRPVAELYGSLPANDFGPAQLRVVREWWLKDQSRSRQYVNKQIKRLIRVIKWAVGQGLLPAEVHQAAKCVEPLRKGRCDAREADPVKPVSTDIVAETIAHLTQVLADMVRFQMLTGCRPGELVRICPGMVERSNDVWEVRFEKHKTAYRGFDRTIYVGPQAQEVLRPYLLRESTQACFSPQESEEQRRQARSDSRQTPLSCGNGRGSNTVTAKLGRKPRKAPGREYSTGSYGKAIRYACKRAFPIPREATESEATAWKKKWWWSPNQLRHTAATEIRKQFGLEAAQVILGHAKADVTQVYAEQNQDKARNIAKLIG